MQRSEEMADCFDDPWICFASEMGEEFFRKHRETLSRIIVVLELFR